MNKTRGVAALSFHCPGLPGNRISPRCHLEDITRSDIYGFVIPFCLELMNLMGEYRIPIKIRVCDTMGYGVNYPGAVIPRSIPGIIYGLMVHAGVPSELIEFHGHNDFYKAVSNATTAWLYGACGVNCSLFGSESVPAIHRWKHGL